MPGRAGIIVEIESGEVRGISCSSTFGKGRVDSMESVSVDGGDIKGGLERLLGRFPANLPVTVLLPGYLFMIRRVTLPFIDRKKIRKALPFELEGQFPLPVEELVIDSIHSGHSPQGSSLISLAVPRARLDEVLDLFPVDRRPINAIPDFLAVGAMGLSLRKETEPFALVDMRDGRATLMIFSEGRPLLARCITSAGDGRSMEDGILETIRSFEKEGTTARKIFLTGRDCGAARMGVGDILTEKLPPLTGDLSAENWPAWGLLAYGAKALDEYPYFSLTGRGMAGEALGGLLRAAAIGAVITLALGTADLYLRYNSDSEHLASLRDASRKAFLTAMPETKKIVREEAQISTALKTAKEAREALSSAEVPPYLETVREIGRISAANRNIRMREITTDGYTIKIAGDGETIDAERLTKIFTITGAEKVTIDEMVQGVDPSSYRFMVRIEIRKDGRGK